jgi:hypothetical protein
MIVQSRGTIITERTFIGLGRAVMNGFGRGGGGSFCDRRLTKLRPRHIDASVHLHRRS